MAAVLVYMIRFSGLDGFLNDLPLSRFDHPIVGVAPDGKGLSGAQPLQGLVGKGGANHWSRRRLSTWAQASGSTSRLTASRAGQLPSVSDISGISWKGEGSVEGMG